MKLYPKMLMKLPDTVNLQDIALLDPFSTAARGIMLSGFRMRETALVIGAGPIGLCTTQQLRLAGASLIAVTEPVERRAGLAKEWGADIVMNPGDDVTGELARHTQEIGVDYVFECVGIPDTTQESFNLVRRGGRVVLVGVCMETTTVQPLFWMLTEISMQTSMGFTRTEIEGTLELMRTGALRTDGFVSETIAIDDLPAMFERLLSPNEEIKVLVEFPE
jgi:2-desacetyl-2-hydroxyethyl bacteriochlorophyllide A dehydrogenase